MRHTAALGARPPADKRLVLAGALLALVAVGFWTGTRYPALSDKAAMGESADVEGLAFDRVVVVPQDAPVAARIGANAANWAYTNRQGMTFGVLFAAVVLTVLPLLTRRQFAGRMSNTLLGVAMGAPLGVCVNCAVPVAEGLHRGGARGETTVAALLSSPTLNVVVLSMTFALFPLWLAGLKLGLTLAFILLGVPLIVRALWGEGVGPEAATLAPAGPTLGPELPPAPAYHLDGPGGPPATWAAAAAWTTRALGRNLGYILKTTLPLMLVAGALGAVVVTVLPWGALVQHLPDLDAETATTRTVLTLAGVAVLGTFLPVPIAFDVVICAILAAAGVPVPYVAVLFVTLGLFSAYPLLQIWRTMSRGAAAGLFLGVAALGLGAGWTAAILQPRLDAQTEAALLATLVRGPDAPPARPRYPAPGRTAAEVSALLAPTAVAPEPWRTQAGVSILREPLADRAVGTSLRFERSHGVDLGIVEPSNATANRLIVGLSENRAVATGDVHGDGWPDLVMTSEAGVGLYANLGGRRFVRQEVAVPALDAADVTGAALVDLDGDGALDLVVATRGANHVVYNDGGGFTEAGHYRLPALGGAHKSTALAFGDLDRDGDLDLVLGNVAGFNTDRPRRHARASLATARNTLLINDGGRGRFTPTPLPGVPGETLSALLSDLDGDGDLDLYIGNDFEAPDVVYLGDGAGGLRMVTRADGLVPTGGRLTMSVISADLDGDLAPELLVTQISGTQDTARRIEPEALCADRADAERADCERFHRLTQVAFQAHSQNDVQACLALPAPLDVEACLATVVVSRRWRGQSTSCEALEATSRWPLFAYTCAAHALDPFPVSDAELATFVPSQRLRRSVLLRASGGAFLDVAEGSGLETLGWSWNTRFADFDLDGRLDLFVSNGTPFTVRSDQAGLFRNTGGLRFENLSQASGAGLWDHAYAHSVVDLDRDGDPDVVVPTVNGPVDVFYNVSGGTALQIALRDDTGANRFGIGAVVTLTLADGSRQMRELQASGGYLSFDEPVATFGLGAAAEAVAVEVRWPTGERTRLRGPFPSGTRYTVRRGA